MQTEAPVFCPGPCVTDRAWMQRVQLRYDGPLSNCIFYSNVRPFNKEDYSLDLVVATERERFVVPIRAVGNKPALDFPDAIEFEPTAAKSSSQKVQTVRNVGSKVGRCTSKGLESRVESARFGMRNMMDYFLTLLSSLSCAPTPRLPTSACSRRSLSQRRRPRGTWAWGSACRCTWDSLRRPRVFTR